MPVAEVIFSGHQLHPGGGAEGLGEGVAEADAFAGHAIQVRGLVAGPAVGAEAFVAEVVGQDQQNVGSLRLGGQGGDGGEAAEELTTVHPKISGISREPLGNLLSPTPMALLAAAM